MDITKEVSITMRQYGRFANPSGWKDIEEALNDFEQRFADTERPTDLPAYHTRDTFSSGEVTLDIISQHFGPQLLSGMEMARIIKTINNLFFVYKDKPREFVIAIHKNRVYLHELTIHWASQRNPWPQHLPWTWNIDDLAMVIFLYGRDFPPSRFFDIRFFAALDVIADKLVKEIDAETQPPRKPSYSFDILNLEIEPPPNDSDVRLTAHSVGSIVHRIRSQLIRRSGLAYGPREFGGLIKDETRQLAKIFLTVHDPEEGIAQE
ncbi:MAG: hypothetical protein Q9180_004097 [Flavoplaca navasiana]